MTPLPHPSLFDRDWWNCRILYPRDFEDRGRQNGFSFGFNLIKLVYYYPPFCVLSTVLNNRAQNHDLFFFFDRIDIN